MWERKKGSYIGSFLLKLTLAHAGPCVCWGGAGVDRCELEAREGKHLVSGLLFFSIVFGIGSIPPVDVESCEPRHAQRAVLVSPPVK